MKRTTDSFIGWCAKRDRSDPTPCDCSRTSSLAVSRFRIGAATGGRSCRWEPSRHVIGPIGRDEPCEYRSLRISAGQFGYDGQIGTNARWHSVVVSRYPRPTSCTVSRRPKTTNSGPTGKVGMYPRLGVLGGDSQSRGVAYARNEGVVGGGGPPTRPTPAIVSPLMVASDSTAGAFSAVPSTAKCDPWQGQSQHRSKEFQWR
jgi:hypothetical protein